MFQTTQVLSISLNGGQKHGKTGSMTMQKPKTMNVLNLDHIHDHEYSNNLDKKTFTSCSY